MTDGHQFNPFAAPEVGPEVADPFQQDETRIRQQFIDCEANILSISSMLMLGGILLAACCVFFIFLISVDGGVIGSVGGLVLTAFMLTGIAQFIVGLKLRSFFPRSRIWAILLCTLWILFFPVGTCLGGVCLWYLLRPAASYVFTPQYRDVVLKTPHVQFQTTRFSWGILLIVLLSTLGLMIFANL